MSENDDNQAVNEVVDTGTTDTDSAPVESTPVADETPIQKDNGELNLKADTSDKPVEEQGEEQAPTEPEQDTKPEAQQEAPSDTEETDSEEQLAPKSQNRFQQLANENREMKAELERLRRQEVQLATEQQLVNEINPDTGEYYTPQEIERITFAQSREQQAQDIASQRYELEVQDVQFQLRDEATRALTDFPMFDETSKDYDPVQAAKVDALLGKNLVWETDAEGKQTGRVIGSQVSPYELYQTVHDAVQSGKTAGQVNGQRATEKMLAQVDGTGSNQKGEGSFDKLSTAEMAERLRRAGHDV